MKWLKQMVRYHMTDMSGVRPECRSNGRAIYLNSWAGLIEYKPKDWRDLVRFRDDVVNRFEALLSVPEGSERRRLMFELYDYARSQYRVKYRANLRTRLAAL